jgi:hypothetical protein
LVAVALVGLVVYLVANPVDTTSPLNQTLPQTVSTFGVGARVVELVVGNDYVHYQLIPADGHLHRRDDYIAGDQGWSVQGSVRGATATERQDAQLRLGDVPRRVVDKLYSRLGIGVHDTFSTATLTGDTWTIKRGFGDSDLWQARYDGSGLRQERSGAAVPGPTNAAPAGTATSPTGTARAQRPVVPAPARGALSVTKSDRLLACIRGAHQDVNKLIACQSRFAP